MTFYKIHSTRLHTLPTTNRGLSPGSFAEHHLGTALVLTLPSPLRGKSEHAQKLAFRNTHSMAGKHTRALWEASVLARHFWGTCWAPHPGCDLPMGVSPGALA